MRLKIVLSLILYCLMSSISSAQAPTAESIPNTFAVRLTPAAAAARGLRPDYRWLRVSATTAENAKNALGKNEVELVEPVYVVHSQDLAPYTPNDPKTADLYALDLMRVKQAWTLTRGSDRVAVVVFDTGADLAHPDLKTKYLGGADYVDGGNPDDQNGHGTHVSGTAAAATNNNLGVPGIGFDTRFVMVRVLNANGGGDVLTISNALTDLADLAPSMQGWHFVANFSLGCQCSSQQMQDAVTYAYRRGILIVAAAGNSNSELHFEPAALPQVIGVAAVDRSGVKAGFSNYGPNVKIAAPGVDIVSTCRGNSYCSMNGTSMASPNVAGVAALVWGAHPTWTNEQVKAALLETARNIGDSRYYGAGLVQAAEAVSYGGSVPQPTPGPSPTRVDNPAPTATPAPDGYAAQVEALINNYRRSLGLPAYRHNDALARASNNHNLWMDTHACFAHQCPGEADPYQRMRNAGYQNLISGSEIIGNGYRTPSEMFYGWSHSGGHDAIMRGRWADMGCAFYDGANGYYTGLFWTCDFATAGTGKEKVEPPVLSGPLIAPVLSGPLEKRLP